LKDLEGSIERTSAFDVVLSVRSTRGVRPVNFYGSFYKPYTPEVEISGMDADQAITIELEQYDNLTNKDDVYIQV